MSCFDVHPVGVADYFLTVWKWKAFLIYFKHTACNGEIVAVTFWVDLNNWSLACPVAALGYMTGHQVGREASCTVGCGTLCQSFFPSHEPG